MVFITNFLWFIYKKKRRLKRQQNKHKTSSLDNKFYIIYSLFTHIIIAKILKLHFLQVLEDVELDSQRNAIFQQKTHKILQEKRDLKDICDLTNKINLIKIEKEKIKIKKENKGFWDFATFL